MNLYECAPPQHTHYIPLTTENAMSIQEIVRECHSENWSPVIVLQYKDKTVVPVFKNHDIAMQFIRRNFGKKVMKTSGTIGMHEDNFDLFTDRGWKVEVFDFPRKFIDRKDVELIIEAFEIPQGFAMPNQGVWN